MIHRLAILMILTAGTAQAETAWDMFTARCLEPYENQALAIHDGLKAQSADQAQEGETVFEPTPEGFILVLNTAPDEGERSCSVHNPSASEPDQAYVSWIENAMDRQVYVPVDGVLSSNEWIEPQLQFEGNFNDDGVTYEIIETELES